MKVGYFVETPVEHNLTGGSRSFLDLLERLVPMGIEPYVVVHEPWALTEELQRRGIPFITTKMYRPFIGVKVKARFYRIKYLIKCLVNYISQRKACKFFRQNGVQLIHINSQFCGTIGCKCAISLSIPYIYHIREFLDSDFGVQFYNPQYAYELIGKASAIIAISGAIEKFMRKKCPTSNICRIYNGLSYEKVGCGDTRRFQGATTQIAIVGRVTPAKNQLEVVKAAKILCEEYHRKIKLHVIGCVGGDEYEEELRNYVTEHGLESQVELLPFSNQVTQITHKCDIGVICSLSEAFGRVTIEYMMANLFTIGCNAGGTPELIEDGIDGFLYEAGHPEQLAEKINWAICHPDQANTMLMRGKEKAIKEFSIQNTAARIFSLYKSVIHG